MNRTICKLFIAIPAVALFLLLFLSVSPQIVSAATTDIKYSPLFEASLQNTLREFTEKESGEYYTRINDAVTEKADVADAGDTETSAKVQMVAFNIPSIPSVPSMPSVPSYTSSYSCGATCGSTCGSTCSSTCGYTCGSTCGSTCAGSSTCIGSSTCAGSSTCLGSSTCAGSNTCVGMSSCAGSSTCFGTNTCVGMSSCAGSSTCFGTSTCSGSSTCIGTSTCSGSSTCSFGGSRSCITPPSGGSSGGGSSGSPPVSDPIPETPKTDPSTPPEPDNPDYGSSGKPSDWATNQVNEAILNNLVPVDLQSNYQSSITRKEFCTLAIQLIKEIPSIAPELEGIMDIDRGKSPFTDVDDSSVTWAYYLDIVNGLGDGRFNPNGYITRQEAAVMLTNIAENVFDLDTWSSSAQFSDIDKIAGWARDSVDFVCACGIMSGVGENNFDPQNLYTREQSIVTILRMFNLMPEE